jgi:hypothetical protein
MLYKIFGNEAKATTPDQLLQDMSGVFDPDYPVGDYAHVPPELRGTDMSTYPNRKKRYQPGNDGPRG